MIDSLFQLMLLKIFSDIIMDFEGAETQIESLIIHHMERTNASTTQKYIVVIHAKYKTLIHYRKPKKLHVWIIN